MVLYTKERQKSERRGRVTVGKITTEEERQEERRDRKAYRWEKADKKWGNRGRRRKADWGKEH